MLFDPGASHTILDSRAFPENLFKYLKQTTFCTAGVGGTLVKAKGEFSARVQLGSGVFKGCTIYVAETDAPPLLGRNIIEHETNLSHKVDLGKATNGQRTVIFERLEGRNRWTDSVKCVPALNTVAELVEKTSHSFAASSKGTLKEKLQWLETSYSIKLDYDNQKELVKFVDLLMEYEDIYSDVLGNFPYEVEIPTKTPNGQSTSQKQHPIAAGFVDKVTAKIQKMLADGVIEISEDPKGYCSPILCVAKPNGDMRLCINYKNTLNKQLVDNDPFPMPSCDECFRKIGTGNQLFSSVDLRSGYWQVPIAEHDRYKTSFAWEGVTYRYKRLPFGLASAGAIFSRAISMALREVSMKKNISIYLDDALLFGKEFSEYLIIHEEFFKAIRAFGLRLNIQKCTFLTKETEFLGRRISSKGYGIVPKYVQGIMDMPPPKNKKQLAGMIGKVSWLREFCGTRLNENVSLTSFTELMHTLYRLRNEPGKFIWTDAAKRAWGKVKSRLSTAPVLSFADFDHEFAMTTDASDVGAAAVLTQCIDGQLKLIGSVSKTFTSEQTRWTATEKETNAIVFGVQKFHYFLAGRKFSVFTDHRSLCYLDQKIFNNPKIERWQRLLMPYHFTVQYLEGPRNVLADMLSRPMNVEKIKPAPDPTAAGHFYKLGKTGMQVYVPSWCLNYIDENDLKLTRSSPEYQSTASHACTRMVTSQEDPSTLGHLDLFASQMDDEPLAKIMHYLNSKSESKFKSNLDKSCPREAAYLKIIDKFYLDTAVGILVHVENPLPNSRPKRNRKQTKFYGVGTSYAEKARSDEAGHSSAY